MVDEMVDRLLDILADKLTERLSAGHKELYTAKELAERYGYHAPRFAARWLPESLENSLVSARERGLCRGQECRLTNLHTQE